MNANKWIKSVIVLFVYTSIAIAVKPPVTNSPSLVVKEDLKGENTSLLSIFDLNEQSSDNLRNLTYKKCLCGKQEIFNGDECIKIDEETIFILMENLQPSPQLKNTWNFEVSDSLKCQNPNQLVTLNGENIYLIDNGNLYHDGSGNVFTADEFCIEFILDVESTFTSVYANVCLSQPVLPFCCKKDNCKLDASEPITISYGNVDVTWSQYEIQSNTEPSCLMDKQIVTSSLNDNKITLFNDLEEVKLALTSASPNIKSQIFSSQDFCLSINKNKRSLEASFCFSDPILEHKKRCKNAVCVRKCCPQDQVYDMTKRICSKHETIFVPMFYSLQDRSHISAPTHFEMEYMFPWCSPQPPYLLDPEANHADEFYLLQNGSLFIALSSLSMPSSKYCVDSFIGFDGLTTTKAISCFLEDEITKDKCEEVHRILYPTLLVISCMFLLVTLLVYASLPELRTKLHGKCLLSHVLSLMIAFNCQLIVSWSSTSLSMTGCRIIGLINQVSFLWAFFWLNVMCFDIWWTLKSMSPSPETGESSRRRFVLYSIYAWGCPLVISFITGLMEFLSKSLSKTGLILPGFGIRGCWFQDTKSTWIYFYGFTLLLYVINILFFFHVAAILIKGQRSTEGILRKTRKQQKERVYLYLKLFIVMGITWICEVASWQEGTCMYWIFTDVVNSLQGVFIFLIFMCNKKVYQKMHAKGLPVFLRMKTMVQTPSIASGDGRSNGSQRTTTTQTSTESSLRRHSSINPPSLQNRKI